MTDAIKPDDEATVGNVSATGVAKSTEFLPESTNNPTTEDTKIPTTDTPVSTLDTAPASSSSPAADSQSGSSSAGSSVLSSGEDLGEGVVSPAASSLASGTASSASNALPVEGTADTAADSSLLAVGKVDAAVVAGFGPVVVPEPVVASTSGGVVGALLPVAPLPVVDSGNVPAAGALDADGTGSQKDDEDRHPAVPHLRALRNKIESGEAIIMADLLNLLHRIEESL